MEHAGTVYGPGFEPHIAFESIQSIRLGVLLDRTYPADDHSQLLLSEKVVQGKMDQSVVGAKAQKLGG